MAGAGFRGGIRIGGVAEPRTFFDEALEATGPLEAELVHVVGAHLIDDEENNEFGPVAGFGGFRAGGLPLSRKRE